MVCMQSNDESMKKPKESPQLELLDKRPSVVHFWDESEALRTGRIVRKIKRGRRQGQYVVEDGSGKRRVGPKIRNIQ
jgi:hypothetical protein